MLVIFLASIGRLTLFFGILGEVLALSALMDDWDYAYIRHVNFLGYYLLAGGGGGWAGFRYFLTRNHVVSYDGKNFF
jgi:hypothetical protein